ncbi:MAG TPA: response regulator [Herpetosiphonaceae bacterium]
MTRPLTVLYVEDREDHVLRARYLLERIQGYAVSFHTARTVVDGERKARLLLDPQRSDPAPTAIMVDMHLPIGAFQQGVDGSVLLNALAHDMQRGRVAPGILIGVSAEMTPSRAAFSLQATDHVWHKPLSPAHMERLAALVEQGPPWAPAAAAPPPALAAVAPMYQTVMDLARQLTIHNDPATVRFDGRAVIGALTGTLRLEADAYRRGVQLVALLGGSEAARAALRAGLPYLPPRSQLALRALLDGCTQTELIQRLALTRRTITPVLDDLYHHVGALVLQSM